MVGFTQMSGPSTRHRCSDIGVTCTNGRFYTYVRAPRATEVSGHKCKMHQWSVLHLCPSPRATEVPGHKCKMHQWSVLHLCPGRKIKGVLGLGLGLGARAGGSGWGWGSALGRAAACFYIVRLISSMQTRKSEQAYIKNGNIWKLNERIRIAHSSN